MSETSKDTCVALGAALPGVRKNSWWCYSCYIHFSVNAEQVIQDYPCCVCVLCAVSDAALCEEAKELEMQKERYIHDLQQALTGTESSITYSFTLTPSPPNHSSTVTLAYEKVQKDISVSATKTQL